MEFGNEWVQSMKTSHLICESKQSIRANLSSTEKVALAHVRTCTQPWQTACYALRVYTFITFMKETEARQIMNFKKEG